MIHRVNLGDDGSWVRRRNKDAGGHPGPSRSSFFCLLRMEEEDKWLENSSLCV